MPFQLVGGFHVHIIFQDYERVPQNFTIVEKLESKMKKCFVGEFHVSSKVVNQSNKVLQNQNWEKVREHFDKM